MSSSYSDVKLACTPDFYYLEVEDVVQKFYIYLECLMIEAAPIISPIVVLKDIADVLNAKMTKAVHANKPAVPESMKTAMKVLIKDAAGMLSQNVGLKSGVAGDRYGHNLTAAVTKTLGHKELAHYKDFTQTYVGAGDELQMAGSPLKEPKDSMGMALQKEILDAINTSIKSRLSPTKSAALNADVDKASKHIAAITKNKGDALDHLVASMKEKGHENLGRLQGYMQTYAEAAERIENASSLATEKVDKASYEIANSKLKALMEDKPNAAVANAMPEVIEDVAKFLGAPPAETSAEKKRMLGEFLNKKANADTILAEEGMYKMTYQDAAKDVTNSPAGITWSYDDQKKKVIEKKLRDAVPNENLKDFFKESVSEAAAHLTDTVKGRGDALGSIHDSMKAEGNKKFLNVGKSQKTYQDAANMLGNARNFNAERAPPGAADEAEKLIWEMNVTTDSPLGQAHMSDTTNIVAKYIAGEMAKEAGMVPGKIGENEKLAARVPVPEKPAHGEGETEFQRKARLEAEKILGRPETPEERKRRLEIEKKLGRPETPEEIRARLEAEKRLGRPETDEEFRKRLAEQDLKKYGRETDAQKQARLAAEKILGRPETDQERKNRLEAEKRLGRPETPEEMRARMAAEKRLGRPETEEEFKNRIAELAKGGGGDETEFQRKARLEAEKILGRPETPEERKRRLEIEKKLGRPETPEEIRARLEAEKRLGRPETDEEFRKRIAEQDLKKYGRETDAQKQARLAAEKILGRPETDQERKNRLEAEKRLGRPETPEEMRARMAAEKRLGRPETEEEFKNRIAELAKGGGGGETEFQRKARLEAEKILGRPETPEERKRRLEIEKKLGRPETLEEIRARLEAEKRLGRPETDEEFRKRIAEQDLKKYGRETDAQKQARLAAEKILGRPETDQDRKNRLEAEKRLGRPETPEEMRARMEAEKRLGRPETEEEFKKRIAELAKGGGGGGSETEFQRKARLEAEKILGRPETPEERQRRLEIEKKLGRPETPEELRARLEAEKRLGRPETEEEFRKRMAEQNLKKYGPETDAQKQASLAAEKILGRPETDQERKNRLEAEKRLGRPETPEEMRARMEAEKRLGRPETEEEFKKRIAELAKGGGGGPGSSETEFQRKARLEAEKILGRPETPEERKRRLEIEKKLGRPETPEELRARLEAEKRLGRPETEEEFRKRMAEQDRMKSGPETDAQRKARLAAEKILGRPETDQERKNRLEAEKRLGRPETPEEMRARMEAEKRLGRPETEEEFKKRMAGGGIASQANIESSKDRGAVKGSAAATGGYDDPERGAAMQLLLKQLKGKGNEIFYEQPKTHLTYSEASDWLKKAPTKVDRSVKESGDTARLTKKFERKLGALMEKATPQQMQDVMQDVIVDSARRLSEYFVAQNYSALVADALIAEMQRRYNEILIEANGVAETNFFAAQRLKLAKSLDTKDPSEDLAYKLIESLTEVAKCCTMSRKLNSKMKEHVITAADYLSKHVTKPEPKIAAYVALLQEMEAAGDLLVIDGEIQKSYKDAASYLRQLTTYDDQIRRSNSNIQSRAESNLKKLMSNVSPNGYSAGDMTSVITQNAALLTSYIMLQVEKTEALKVMINRMDCEGDNVLLRHGIVRKTYTEGADTMRGKNTDQLTVTGADPVAARKIQIKLIKLMSEHTPDKFKALMDDVIEDAMEYLAVALLQPHKIKTCKCKNNVFVQCELWCEEILRRVALPCCTCARHVSTQALADLVPHDHLRLSPHQSHAFAPGLDIELSQCPAVAPCAGPSASCPAVRPCPGLVRGPQRSTTSYMVYETTRDRDVPNDPPVRLPRPPRRAARNTEHYLQPRRPSSVISITSGACSHEQPIRSIPEVYSFESDNRYIDRPMFAQNPTVMQSTVHSELNPCQPPSSSQSNGSIPTNSSTPTFTSPPSSTQDMPSTRTSRCSRRVRRPSLCTARRRSMGAQNFGLSIPVKKAIPKPSNHYTPYLPSTTTDQMSDWHSMMLSLMWNVRAWSGWMQSIVERALVPQPDSDWASFQRKVILEAVQWRQYNIFSRHLTLRLSQRYRDKRIVSPVRGTEKTHTYLKHQREMFEIIDMFSRWTRWLILIIKDTESIRQTVDSNILLLNQLRWSHFKRKIEENAVEWVEYNRKHIRFWDNKYKNIVSEWLPSLKMSGPVWVVSACGAVPSGAVPAGMHENEVIWLARTTHKSEVLPAALVPSKQCCFVYANGAVHHYTKYQVMCNAKVEWVPWRGSVEEDTVGSRAVRVAPGVHVGRVQYRGAHLVGAVRAPAHRCHVVILGRAFAFNCYDLLVLADNGDNNVHIDP